MTGTAGVGSEGESVPGRPPVCVLDAVACVHFAGANLNRVLVAALEFAQWVILVPEEVCDEVRGKDTKYPGLAKRWAALERSPYLRVLPGLQVGEKAQARVIAVLEDLRQCDFEEAVRRFKDLGECVVVAHGVDLLERGHEVTLLMDDRGGLEMAARHGLTCATIEDVLSLAIFAGCFESSDALSAAYRKLQAYGSGLADFRHTTLQATYEAWRQDAFQH